LPVKKRLVDLQPVILIGCEEEELEAKNIFKKVKNKFGREEKDVYFCNPQMKIADVH
jgi:hypothetical protein